METSGSIIPYLFLATFVLAIAIGIWQYRKAKKARSEHHQSADARVHGERTDPAPPQR